MPKLGSVYWMRDERRAALVTVSICAAVVLIGVLVRFPVVGPVVACAIALMRFSGYRERRRLRRHMLAHRQRLAEELESGQAHAITCRPSGRRSKGSSKGSDYSFVLSQVQQIELQILINLIRPRRIERLKPGIRNRNSGGHPPPQRPPDFG